MALVVYLKSKPKSAQTGQATSAWRRDRFFFALIAFIGLSSMLFTMWPLLTWQLSVLPRLTHKLEALPIPQSRVLSQKFTLEESVQVVEDPDGFSYFVPTSKPEDKQGERPDEFFLTVPKLKIEKAKTEVDSLNFYKHLSHFPGSALPGEVGNSFITGHSVLPQFADPKNYKGIFTKLSDLEIGDSIFVEINGNQLQFVVQYAKIVDPHDLSVLAPISQSGRNLTLMTCVPPGTNSKRLVVISNLI